MNEWTSGYVADVGYTYGYYSELNPERIKLAFLSQGLVYPQIGVACELGFGQGLSVNMHASGSIVNWSGTDFNPSQASYAQELAKVSQSKVQLFDQAFSQYCQREDLPDFDFIALHGIWSWISDENRKIIVDFLNRKLKVGGVVYISYNTQPGWSSFAPVRHLMSDYVSCMCPPGQGTLQSIDSALDFTQKLLDVKPAFARVNPGIGERVQQVKALSRNYLAHEYFNKDWAPMHFSSIAKMLETAKLEFACSANYMELVEIVNLSQEQQALLAGISDLTLRQGVRDFLVNQQFRKDYWVKGARKIAEVDRWEAIGEITLILTTPSQDVELKISGALGEAKLQEEVYRPILDLMSHHQPLSVSQLQAALHGAGVNIHQLLQAMLLLVAAGHVQPARAVSKEAQVQCEKLNNHLLKHARSNSDISYLVSPVTGGGYAVNRIQQLFTLAINQGHNQRAQWVQFAWGILSKNQQKLIKEGLTLESEQENLQELESMSVVFQDKYVPILKSLKIMN